MRRFLAVLSFVAVTSCGATTAFAQNCVPLADAMARMQNHPMTADVHMASAAEVKLAVEIFNAMPPQSEDKFDLVVMATATSGAGMLLLGNEGQICQGAPFPPEVWRVFVRSVRGEVS